MRQTGAPKTAATVAPQSLARPRIPCMNGQRRWGLSFEMNGLVLPMRRSSKCAVAVHCRGADGALRRPWRRSSRSDSRRRRPARSARARRRGRPPDAPVRAPRISGSPTTPRRRRTAARAGAATAGGVGRGDAQDLLALHPADRRRGAQSRRLRSRRARGRDPASGDPVDLMSAAATDRFNLVSSDLALGHVKKAGARRLVDRRQRPQSGQAGRTPASDAGAA